MSSQVTDSIFISYRRDDTRADAGRLCDRLEAHFGDAQVFMDIDDIRPGQRFNEVLQRTLDACDVLIVLIGRNWLSARDENGALRLDDEQDFVRMEVQSALERGLEIIPVLVDRASMPSAESLPPALAPLALRQAIEISDARFHQDVDRLVEVLESFAGKKAGGISKRIKPWIILAVAVIAGSGILTGIIYWSQAGKRLPAPQAESVAPKVVTLRSTPTAMTGAEVKAMLVRSDFFDATWHPMGKGLDHDYELTTAAGEAVVIDRRTGLMWQQAGSARPLPFTDAEAHIQGLNGQSFGGHGDWRLPTLEEAMSLLTPAAIGDGHVSPVLSWRDAPIIWTADTAGEDRCWVVYAGDGIGRPERQSFNAWARAVRSMP